MIERAFVFPVGDAIWLEFENDFVSVIEICNGSFDFFDAVYGVTFFGFVGQGMCMSIGAETNPANRRLENFKIVSVAFVEIILDFSGTEILKLGGDFWNVDVKNFGFVFGHELILSTERLKSKAYLAELLQVEL